VVVSIAAGQAKPYVDDDDIAAAVAGLAEVYVIPTGHITWAYSNEMPPPTEVYGGASRVYPVGLEWVHNTRRSPLRFAYGPDDDGRVTDTIISDAMTMANAANLTRRSAAKMVRAAGTVKRIVGGRGMVELSVGRSDVATIWPELTAREITGDRLLVPGMWVEGLLDVEQRRLDVGEMRVSAKEVLVHYTEGAVVLVRVRHVERRLCVVELYPELQVNVEAQGVFGGENVDLRDLMTRGEVLTARVEAHGKDVEDWQLSLLELEAGAEPLTAPAVLRGGPPWLLPPGPEHEPAVEHDAGPTHRHSAVSALPPPHLSTVVPHPKPGPGPHPDPPPTVPSPQLVPPLAQPGPPAAWVANQPHSPHPPPSAPGSHLPTTARPWTASTGRPTRVVTARSDPAMVDALAAMRAERDGLLTELRRARDEARSLDASITTLRTELRRSRDRSARARQALDRAGEAVTTLERDSSLFADPQEQLRFEVNLDWARRTTPDEKNEVQLRPWSVGPDFLASWADTQGLERGKVVAVIVDVLNGRAISMDSRQAHPLRAGAGGEDKPRIRADGAMCWRVSLQQKTAAARRLHYWQLPNGAIELSGIRLHDDMRP